MDKNELKYWLGISAIPEIGPVRFKKILNYFQPLASFFTAQRSELLQAGIENWVVDQILLGRNSLSIESKAEEIGREKITIITCLDDDYPPLLKEIYDYPPLLYIKGNLTQNNNLTLAVVGTRRPTYYGEEVVRNIVKGLVQSRVTVVSGLALGIDSLAHRATIEAGGKTIAVLGSGLDWRSIYPSENKKLVESIVASGGAVLSELPCGMAPHKSNFPLRNRLISGLSLGTLVVEAGEKSGALITAQTALEQNREVLAVPGNIFSGTAMGVNNLIKAGARLVTSVNDVLETLNLTLIKEHVTMREVKPESPEEELILSLLSQEPLHIDQLILWSGLPSQVINSTLLMMEIKGKIKDVGGKRYVIK